MTTYVCSALDTANGVCLQWVEYVQPSLLDENLVQFISGMLIAYIILWGIKSMFKIVLSLMGFHI